jgi:hypothetical protein
LVGAPLTGVETDMRRYLLGALLTFAGGTLADAQTLDQQEHCAADAKRYFNDYQAQFEKEQKEAVDGGGYMRTERYSAEYRNHCDTKLGKCFILITLRQQVFGLLQPAPNGVMQDIEFIADVNENREYGAYWKIYDVGMGQCWVNFPANSKYCKSRPEFEALVAPYLEE